MHVYVHTRIYFIEELYMTEEINKVDTHLNSHSGVPSYPDGGFSRFCLVPPAICRNSAVKSVKAVQSHLPGICYVQLIYGTSVYTT
jgi:hypothetical protein